MTSNGAHSEMTSPPPLATSDNSSNDATTPQTIVIKGRRYRQRQLGPAPFASFEDLSDELDSPPETARIPLPGIKEDPSSQLQSPNTPLPQLTELNITEKEEQCLKESLTSSLDAPAPPRIDISRASSSSQHEDSITSSPERENGTHNLGYKEDGTVDLRSSTEELDYIQEPGTVHESEERRKREKMMRRQQQVRDFGDTQSQHEFMERKDSSCSVMSDVGLLCISGRTSRLSSIGSAASGGSAASAGSHLSGRSTRSPSPHKMLLETSFCGSKPMLNADSELADSLATSLEKAASRPPSRLRSRSPSPHKMLLETSFCGAKQISLQETNAVTVSPKAEKKDESKTSPTLAVEPVIEEQKVPKAEASPPQPKKIEKERTEDAGKLKPVKTDQPKRSENAAEPPEKTKALALPKKPAVKPKKIISIRDIPGDEIYIPLKGPELDLEEIIRNASPNVQKKIDTPKSSDEVFISLPSPPKSPIGKEKKDSTSRSTAKSSKAKASQKGSSRKPQEKGAKIALREKQQVAKPEPKKMEYEVCEDGSIFIPLHSPDENKRSNNFESEIKRVDKELQKAREAAERRMKEEEEEKQRKPDTLDLTDSGSHKSRLSQAYPSGKSEIPSGGSRTPSPGSTLSRKSSFASLFRKSDIFSSPDSQTASTARKKSGTFSNILKEASDGLRERSRSRSKSKERQPQASTSARSPSGKKNVFTNLFTKKKADVKASSGADNEQPPPRLDLQFTFAAGTESTKDLDEGDYIIIPLRDPSDPPDSSDHESSQVPEKSDHSEERPPSPMVILEKRDSPKAPRKTATAEGEPVDVAKASKSSSKNSLAKDKNGGSEAASSESADPGSLFSKEGVEGEGEGRAKTFVATPDKRESYDSTENQQQSTRERSPISVETKSVRQEMSDVHRELKESVQDESREGDNHADRPCLQHDSSLEIEEKDFKEEILPVTANDVRKLKLPPEPGDLDDDHERKGLVYQESFEDELPYVPTTLPLERSVGVPIVPVKHRVNEIKTCSIERPRSTTPINPTALEDFVSAKETVHVNAEEKMKISLPRDNSITSKSKSPTRCSGKGKTWFEFAEAGLQSPRDYRKSSLRTTPSPPPLPPRSSPPSVLSSSAPPTTTSWINFEELPEKRRLPKRITTIPTLRGSADGGDKSGTSVGGGVVYSYVSPEDCQCECHDQNASHGKESDLERGWRNDFMLESNGEFVKKGFVTKKKTSKPREINEKNGCKDCESGIHATGERDAEETPLLGVNSDDEEDFVSGKASPLNKPRGNLDVDRTPHLSDSSCDFGSHEALHEVEHNYQAKDAKPFAMDLEVDSNHSSLLSQDTWSSPEEADNNLQH